jgi:NTE family protein
MWICGIQWIRGIEMKPVIDLDKVYGIVLEGGGAKGAYQIGAWKALKEAGVKINAVAGTSVGALNGALICMDDLERAEQLWNEISYSKVMDVDDSRMTAIFDKKINLREALKDMIGVLGDGGADITPLKELIADNVEEKKIRESGIDFYILTFSLTEMKELDIDIKNVEEGLIPDLLLASAYIFPFFKNEKLHGKNYIDGGIFNNVPLGSLVDRGQKDIIMIRIFGVGREKKVKLPDDVTVINIEPRVNLGNILDFNATKSKRNMKIGYYDALRVIYGLKGRIYYIEENEEECYYLRQLLCINKEAESYLMNVYKINQEESLFTRTFVEIILPAIASELKLSKNWTYEELYIGILEASAKILRIQKYRVYRGSELLEAIKKKGKKSELNESYPPFVYLAMSLKG